MVALIDRGNVLERIHLGEVKNPRLNLGCGAVYKKPGFIGVDLLDHPQVDIVGDVFTVLSEISDNTIGGVYSSHFFEHVDDINLLVMECARVLKSGGNLDVIVPHFSNPYFYSDPTHVRFFGLYTFSYFSKDDFFKRKVPTYDNTVSFSLDDVRLNFQSSKPFYFRYVFKKIVGFPFSSNVYMMEFWEENLSRIIPCYDIKYRLTKL